MQEASKQPACQTICSKSLRQAVISQSDKAGREGGILLQIPSKRNVFQILSKAHNLFVCFISFVCDLVYNYIRLCTAALLRCREYCMVINSLNFVTSLILKG